MSFQLGGLKSRLNMVPLATPSAEGNGCLLTSEQGGIQAP